MSPNEQLITWLRDAHAMEQSLMSVLERHIQDTRDLPEMRERLSQHRDETREHARRLQTCLESLDSSPSSVKSISGTAMGALQGMSTMMFSDSLVKDALADYAMEHLEIGCYSALIAAAEEAGEEKIAHTCREILREETAMARWLEEQIPALTRHHLHAAAANPR